MIPGGSSSARIVCARCGLGTPICGRRSGSYGDPTNALRSPKPQTGIPRSLFDDTWKPPCPVSPATSQSANSNRFATCCLTRTAPGEALGAYGKLIAAVGPRDGAPRSNAFASMDVVHRGVLSQVSTRPWRDHRPAPTGNYRRFVASSAWGEIPHLCGLEVGTYSGCQLLLSLPGMAAFDEGRVPSCGLRAFSSPCPLRCRGGMPR